MEPRRSPLGKCLLAVGLQTAAHGALSILGERTGEHEAAQSPLLRAPARAGALHPLPRAAARHPVCKPPGVPQSRARCCWSDEQHAGGAAAASLGGGRSHDLPAAGVCQGSRGAAHSARAAHCGTRGLGLPGVDAGDAVSWDGERLLQRALCARAPTTSAATSLHTHVRRCFHCLGWPAARKRAGAAASAVVSSLRHPLTWLNLARRSLPAPGPGAATTA